MPKIIILTGNIGSGKSTLCRRLCNKGYLRISRDSFRYMLGGGNYLFDRLLEPFVHELEMKAFGIVMATGRNIVIDETCVSARSRRNYILKANKYFPGYKIVSIEMPRFSREESLERRFKNPHGSTDFEVWSGVWDRFDRRYESPEYHEGFDKIFRIKKDIKVK